jgi:hypothetical protein
MLKLRLRVIQHLGGHCIRCGYATPGPALQIDHVNGDGAASRRGDASPGRVLRDALYDTEGRYQLLCANCNNIKRIENGEHKGSRVYTRTVTEDGRTKYCATCGVVKSTAEFYRNKARHDGLSVYCKPCALVRTSGDAQRARDAAIDHLGGQCSQCRYDTNRRALQIDHVDGGGHSARQGGIGRATPLYRAVIADDSGRYQLLCANCNVLKKVSAREFRQRHTYARNPATERRPTRCYLSPAEVAEVARLVAVEGLPQWAVGARFGITQSVVSSHTRKHYPEYDGRATRWEREARVR